MGQTRTPSLSRQTFEEVQTLRQEIQDFMRMAERHGYTLYGVNGTPESGLCHQVRVIQETVHKLEKTWSKRTGIILGVTAAFSFAGGALGKTIAAALGF